MDAMTTSLICIQAMEEKKTAPDVPGNSIALTKKEQCNLNKKSAVLPEIKLNSSKKCVTNLSSGDHLDESKLETLTSSKYRPGISYSDVLTGVEPIKTKEIKTAPSSVKTPMISILNLKTRSKPSKNKHSKNAANTSTVLKKALQKSATTVKHSRSVERTVNTDQKVLELQDDEIILSLEKLKIEQNKSRFEKDMLKALTQAIDKKVSNEVEQKEPILEMRRIGNAYAPVVKNPFKTSLHFDIPDWNFIDLDTLGESEFKFTDSNYLRAQAKAEHALNMVLENPIKNLK